jgi:hypothetical protein
LDYDDDLHQYSDGGVIIPSVTQIIYRSSSVPWFTKASSDRGHEAHRLCADYARNPTFFPTQVYVDSFALWCFKRNPQWVELESVPIAVARELGLGKDVLKQYSIDAEVDGFRFAGRCDGLADIEDMRTLADWKSGVKSPKFRAQLGGYALATKPRRAMVLYLHDDMTYDEDWLPSSVLAQGIQEFRGLIREYYAVQNPK